MESTWMSRCSRDCNPQASLHPQFCWVYGGIIPQDFFLVKFHRVSQHRRSAQALSVLGSFSAQLAHPLAQAAQVAQVFAQSPFPSVPTS
jgi:hypothetical protein